MIVLPTAAFTPVICSVVPVVSLAAVPTLDGLLKPSTVKVLLVTDPAAPSVAVRDLPSPFWSTLRLMKVAIPLAAVVCAAPPLSVPPPLRLIVTEVPLLGLPNASVTSTVTAGENVCPTLTVVGVVLAAVIRYALAVVTLTVNPLDVAPVRPLLLAVRVLLAPAVVGMIALKVATPLDAATVSVLAVNAVLALPMVTLALLPVTV